jgi:hypothetical protein
MFDITRYKIVSGGKDKTVRVWSVLEDEGEELRVFDGFNGKVSSITVFHNEMYLFLHFHPPSIPTPPFFGFFDLIAIRVLLTGNFDDGYSNCNSR